MTETVAPPAASGRSVLRIVLGLLLTLPAAGACLLSMLSPTLRQILMSFQDVALFGEEAKYVGFDNYADLARLIDGSGAPAMFVMLSGLRLALVLIIPLLLALGLSRARRGFQLAGYGALAIPAASFAPFVALVAWYIAVRPMRPDVFGMRGMLLVGDAITTLTAACAVGVPIYLAALRRNAGEKIAWRPVIIIWVISLLAVIALSVQEFGVGFVIQGGPMRSTETLISVMYRVGFQMIRIGQGAAVGTIALAAVIILGLAAGILLATSNLSMQTIGGAGDEGTGASGGSVVIGLLMVLALLGCIVVAGLPYLAQLLPSPYPAREGVNLLERVDLGAAFVMTVLPQVLGVFLVQLPLSYIAALGIGGLRPLGKASELLLILFSPWLFMTAAPLLIVFFMDARNFQIINNFIGLMPRFAISVPVLFVLTYFFKGQELKRQAGEGQGLGSFFRTLILPSLPLALLLGLAAVLAGMQGIAQPLVMTNDADLWTVQLVLMQTLGQYAASPDGLGQMIFAIATPFFVFFVLAFLPFLVFYLPRLSLSGPAASLPMPESKSEPEQAAPAEAPATDKDQETPDPAGQA